MWKDEAACRGEGVTLWFSRRTSKAGKKAVAICEGCPVRQQCLADAMEAETGSGLRLGIWGGLGPAEREARGG